MCLSSFQQYLFSGSKDLTIRAWKCTSYNENVCIGKFSGHSECISCLSIFPKTGDRIVSASQDKTIKVWECSNVLSQDDTLLISNSLFTQVAHEKAINAVKISPNEAIIATSSQDKSIKVDS